MSTRVFARLALVPVALLVTYGTLGPAPTYPGDPATYGALAHLGASALLVALARLATGAPLRLIITIAVVVAVGVELAQTVRPGRSPELIDVVFDAAGIAAGSLPFAGRRIARFVAAAD